MLVAVFYMADPLRRLKFLPWLSLIQVSLLTALIVVFLDFLIVLGAQSPGILSSLRILFSPSLGSLTTFAGAVGVGALGVYLLERFYSQVLINTASLWALVLCLALVLILKSLLPVPTVLVNLDETKLIAIVLGVFWKGRPYWK